MGGWVWGRSYRITRAERRGGRVAGWGLAGLQPDATAGTQALARLFDGIQEGRVIFEPVVLGRDTDRLGFPGFLRHVKFPVPGLEPGIHLSAAISKAWVAGSSPATGN